MAFLKLQANHPRQTANRFFGLSLQRFSGLYAFLNIFAYCFPCYFYIVAALQAHPEIRRTAKELGKTEGSSEAKHEGFDSLLVKNGSNKRIDNVQSAFNLLAVLHIFGVKGVAVSFQRGGDNKAVIPGKAVPLPDIEGGMDGDQRYNFHSAHRFK
jgi:hypothetical protein